MATNIKFKRSAVQGKAPTTADLDLGQLALNTYDGILYLKKSVDSVESIVGLSNNYNNLENTPNLADVALSGDYADLINTPDLSVYALTTSLPTKVSDLTNDSGFITSSSLTWNNITSKPTFATVATSGSYSDLSNKPTHIDNGVYSITVNSNGTISFPAFNFPATIGSPGQVLKVPPTGSTLIWATQSGGGGSLTVSEIDGSNNNSNQVTDVAAIRFDNTTGFAVTDLGNGEVKVSLGSSFKTWKVAGQSDLIASGEDTVEFIAGAGITLQTDPLANPKQLIIAATGSGGLDQTVEYFTGDGETVNFNLANTVTDPDYAVVSLNGVELQYGVDFTFISSGTVLRFEEADATENPPADGATISVRIFAPGGSVVGSIDDLTDVDTTTSAPTVGQTLVWNGTNWVPGNASTVGSIDDLSDVDTTTDSPTVGQTLVWDGTNWVPGDAGAAGGAPIVSNFVGDGTTTNFDLDHVIASESVVLVFVNSVYQDTDVYSVSGSEVIFTEAPYEDDRINIILLTTTIASGVNGIDDLTDVDTTTDSPTVGQTLVWDGTNWVPGDAIPAGLNSTQQLTYRNRIGAASVEDAIMLSIVMA